MRREGQQPEPYRIRLTNREIEKLPAGERRYPVYDDEMPGLLVRVSPTGKKAFFYSARVNGRKRMIKLGEPPALTVAAARKLAQKHAGQVAEGIDVAEQRRQARRENQTAPTVEDAWHAYRDGHLVPNCSPKTLKGDEYCWAAIPWPKRRLDSLTTRDVAKLHEDLAKRGPVWANRVIEFLRRIINHSADELGFRGENPVKLQQGKQSRRKGQSVRRARERSRQRYIEPREIGAFVRAIETEGDPDVADFVRMMLYTGARRSNVLGMKWADVSESRRVWTIPAGEAKAGEAIELPLSSYATAVLDRRGKRADPNATFVFPSKRAASGHMTEPKKRWQALRARAGLDDLTLHDLRRTVGSWASMTGTPYAVVKAMLGHAEGKDVTMIYARSDTETVRAAFENTTRAMLIKAKVGTHLAHVRK
jgi:integrase